MYEGTTVVYEGPPFFYRHFACSLSLSFLMKEPYMKDHLSFETTLKIKQKWFQGVVPLYLCQHSDLSLSCASSIVGSLLKNNFFKQEHIST